MECRSSFIKVTKLKTAIAGKLTYTETKNHCLTPQYAGDISVTIGSGKMYMSLGWLECVLAKDSQICGLYNHASSVSFLPSFPS